MERKNFQLVGKALLARLRKVCDGLFYVSETDSEIVPFMVGKTTSRTTKEFFIELTRSGDRAVEEGPADGFFERLTADRDWHGPAERRTVRRFRNLERILSESLSDLAMIRIGRIRVEIFLAGRDTEGNIVGIKTKSVET